MEEDVMPHLAHFAIYADDVPRAKKFYEKVFGWKFSAWGPPNFYQIQTGDNGGKQPALGALQGRRNLVAGQPTIGYECTISVESIDDTIAAVQKNGGTIALPKSIISGVGALAFFRDTEGNVFGAIQFDSKIE
jgi:predicted enzyme related to lactoylglutathione lyase